MVPAVVTNMAVFHLRAGSRVGDLVVIRVRRHFRSGMAAHDALKLKHRAQARANLILPRAPE